MKPEHFIYKSDGLYYDIPGYEGYYKVTTDGRVWSIRKNRELKGQISVHGYHVAQFSVDGNQKRIPVHRLVAITFIQNPHNKPCVNHINFIRTDNRVENLEWCTYRENTMHSFQSGRLYSGKNKGMWKWPFICGYCGCTFRGLKPTSKFCSNHCKMKHRNLKFKKQAS